MRDVVGYEGLYKVTEEGQIWSCKYNRWMKVRIDRSGYPQVGLYKKPKCTSTYIHRIVALAYIPNPNSYPQVNHLDSNPQNPHAGNLEWCTQSQNALHAYKAGRNKAPFKGQKRPEVLNWLTPFKKGQVPWNKGMKFDYKPVMSKRKEPESLVCPGCNVNKRPSTGLRKDGTRKYRNLCDKCRKSNKAEAIYKEKE